ncbi:hypothetical protein C8R45DRAFT_1096838 [Mycena sanguinolenta]|nr:hypothetical protein C8R45DRAFT_1096838 [Mycena sanguinolenta]
MHSFNRSFSANPALLDSGHPYPLHSSSQSCTIQFFEFRGIGAPPPEFGQAGDVYVDLTPGLHALYWRERDHVRGVGASHWRKWTALLLDTVPLHKFLVPHPWARSADLYLWVDPGGVTWTTKDNICASRVEMIRRNIATVVPGTFPNVEALVSEVLHRMLEAERHATMRVRQKEKEVIGMSYHYQKRERELVAALDAAQRRSSAELEKLRAAVYSLKRQAEAAQQETQEAVDKVRSSQEGMRPFSIPPHFFLIQPL